MLQRFSFILASLSLGAVLLITTLLSADRQQLNSFGIERELSAQPRMLQRSVVQRFGPAVTNAAPPEGATREEIVAAATKWDAARPVLDSFWRGEFVRQGIRYATPRVLYMVDDLVDTGC